jgi:DNA-binding transcriptional MerR regulator
VQLSDLSRESGLSIPTIKYYLREGLLPAGRATSSHAEYGDTHLHRLRLIRALVQVGDLPLVTVGQIVAAIDDESLSMHEVLGVAHYALARRGAHNAGSPELEEGRREVDAFLDDRGWQIKDDAPDRDELASALLTLRRLGWDVNVDVFTRYAKAADRLAAWELSRAPADRPRESTVEGMVVGTVVFDSVLSALRRLAEEHHSKARFG